MAARSHAWGEGVDELEDSGAEAPPQLKLALQNNNRSTMDVMVVERATFNLGRRRKLKTVRHFSAMSSKRE